jgi:1-deoxy-D-xylulose-5-phosphate reductoisomerase
VTIGVAVLGATGSIGTSTLDVLARHPDRYHVVALSANAQAQRMAELCATHRPRYAVMGDPRAAQELRDALNKLKVPVEVVAGADGLEQLASLPEVHTVVAAIVGAAGLRSTLAAARAGKRILLANKEALVMSGQLFMDEVRHGRAELLPVDSEHNAIFQCMPPSFADGIAKVGVRRILLTASGGPFRATPLEQLKSVTPEQAIAHPNWRMGKKISVDSATMMNKGLEVIEARWLFDATPEQIQVVLHPQSVIHSMVEYCDGSVLAQLGNPDMRTPIAHALAWPERIESGVAALDIFRVAQLDFARPDVKRFPCLRLAFECVRAGGTSGAILNAANEVAVQAFLDGRLGFTGIPQLVDRVLDEVPSGSAGSLDEVLDADRRAREAAEKCI